LTRLTPGRDLAKRSCPKYLIIFVLWGGVLPGRRRANWYHCTSILRAITPDGLQDLRVLMQRALAIAGFVGSQSIDRRQSRPRSRALGGGYRPGSVCRAILRACNIGPDRRVMIRRWRPLVTIARPPSRGRDALKIEGGVGTKRSFWKVAKADRWTHEFDDATCKVSPHGPSPAALMKHCRWKYLDTMMGAGSLTWLICVVAIGRDSPPSDSALPSGAGIFVRSSSRMRIELMRH